MKQPRVGGKGTDETSYRGRRPAEYRRPHLSSKQKSFIEVAQR
jgi:hypothetical protein